jgi:hypothetical protein
MPLPLVDLANIIKAEHASHTAQTSSNLSEIVKLANEIQQLVFDNALNISSTQDSYVDLLSFFNVSDPYLFTTHFVQGIIAKNKQSCVGCIHFRRRGTQLDNRSMFFVFSHLCLSWIVLVAVCFVDLLLLLLLLLLELLFWDITFCWDGWFFISDTTTSLRECFQSTCSHG